MAVKKTFGDLHLDDKIGILNPHGPTLQEARLKQITSGRIFGYKIITYFIPHPQADLLADDHPKKPTGCIMVKSTDSTSMLATIPPIIVGASKEEVEKWMKG